MARRDKATRRQFLKTAGSGLAVATVGSFSPVYRNVSAANAKGKVLVASGSGTYQKAQIDAYFTPFTKATGIEVEVYSVLSLAQKKAMMETKTVEVDVIGHALSDIVVMAQNKWLEPIDYSVFRKEDLQNIAPQDRLEFGLGFIYWAEVMAHRTDVYPQGKHPRTWADFWDTKRFPGPRSLGDPSYAYSLEFALLADGIPPEKLYPLDIDRALRSMSRIRKDVLSWWGKSAALPAQQMNDKEIVLCAVANGRIIEVINAGAPVAIEWNHGMLYHTFYSVPKGAKNKDNAMRLLAYIARPEPQAEMSRQIPYGPTNRKAYDFIDPKLARVLPTYPEYRDRMFVKNEEWWAATSPSGKSNREIVIDKWEAWKLG